MMACFTGWDRRAQAEEDLSHSSATSGSGSGKAWPGPSSVQSPRPGPCRAALLSDQLGFFSRFTSALRASVAPCSGILEPEP